MSMTRAEKLSIAIASLALFLSVAVPLLMYGLFQNEVRIQQIKAASLRTHVSGFSVIPENGQAIFDDTVVIEIMNDGALPVGDVEVILERKTEKSFYEGAQIKVTPPIGVSTNLNEGVFTVSFNKPLAAGEKVTVNITAKASVKRIARADELAVWVRSEAAPTMLAY